VTGDVCGAVRTRTQTEGTTGRFLGSPTHSIPQFSLLASSSGGRAPSRGDNLREGVQALGWLRCVDRQCKDRRQLYRLALGRGGERATNFHRFLMTPLSSVWWCAAVSPTS